MAVDEALADRVRAVLARTANITERAMFGGLHHDHDARASVPRLGVRHARCGREAAPRSSAGRRSR
jgi:hypothetical protein